MRVLKEMAFVFVVLSSCTQIVDGMLKKPGDAYNDSLVDSLADIKGDEQEGVIEPDLLDVYVDRRVEGIDGMELDECLIPPENGNFHSEICRIFADIGEVKDIASGVSGWVLYAVVENACIVRKLNILTGEITTVAGQSGVCGNAPMLLNHPTGIARYDRQLFIADTGGGKIKRLNLIDGTMVDIFSIEGGCHLRGGVVGTSMNRPTGIAVCDGSVYVSETGTHVIWRIVDPKNESEQCHAYVVAGTLGESDPDDANHLRSPLGLGCSGQRLYIVDSGHKKIKAIDLPSLGGPEKKLPMEVVAGGGAVSDPANESGCEEAMFRSLKGIDVMEMDGGEILIVSDERIIRKIHKEGTECTVSLFAGLSMAMGCSDGTRSAARLKLPWGIDFDPNDSHIPRFFIADEECGIYIGK